MRRRSVIRPARLLVGAAAGAMLLTAAPSAAGAGTNSQPTPTYGLRPALAGRTTLQGGHFTYSVPAGAHVHDAVEVFDFSPAPITMDMYRANLTNTAQGGLAPGQPADRPTGATAWITLDEATLDMVPRSESVDPFMLAVPPGTPPGSYLAAIVGAPSGGVVVGGNLVQQSRVALIVDVTVIGRSHPKLALGPLQARRTGAGEVMSLAVRNTGNVLVTIQGTVTVHRGSPTEVQLSPPDLYIIPGGTATLTGTWRRLPVFGQAHLDAAVTASVDAQTVGTYRARSISLLFVPWLGAGLAAGALVALALGSVLTRQRRRTWLARRAEDRRILAAHRAQNG